jgi:hypothetical protein
MENTRHYGQFATKLLSQDFKPTVKKAGIKFRSQAIFGYCFFTKYSGQGNANLNDSQYSPFWQPSFKRQTKSISTKNLTQDINYTEF